MLGVGVRHGDILVALKWQSRWHGPFTADNGVGIARLYIAELFQFAREYADNFFIGFCFALKLDCLRVEKLNQAGCHSILRLKKAARRLRRATLISCADHCCHQAANSSAGSSSAPAARSHASVLR